MTYPFKARLTAHTQMTLFSVCLYECLYNYFIPQKLLKIETSYLV